MSFFDGIVNGFKAAFGIDSHDDRSAKRPPKVEQPRSENLAADTPTKFEREERSYRGPTLADRLAATEPATPAATGYRTLEALPPHARSSRGMAPPAATDATSGSTGSSTLGSTTTTTPTTARARVSDASTRQVLGTVDNLGGEDAASTAAAHVQRGLDYFATTFGRNGVDGAGAGVEVLINDRSTDADGTERFAGNGGYYATPQADGTVSEAIHFGTGKAYDAARGHVEQHEMLYADDLAIHELVHGIIRKETGHLGGEADEAGATNEAVADVMAAAATRDWKLGEGMYSERSDYRAMRNIAQPDDPTAIHGLWTHMDQVTRRQRAGEEVEEHWASGVISTAAHRVQSRIGGEAGWNVVERVFYDTIDNNRMGDMSFASVASGLRASAAAVYGQGSGEARTVDQELRRAGL